MALRISRVQVAPMKMPSSIHDAMPIRGAATNHGRYSRASDRTSGSVVRRLPI